MIRQFIARIFGGKSAKTGQDALPIGFGKHGIRRVSISSGGRRTVETLQQHGYKAFIVGGAVRDLLLGKTPKDFDVATNATPEEVRRCFRRARIIGRRFQIVHVMMGAETIEVTTFRGPHPGSSHAAQVDEKGRVLRDNVFGSQKDDAARRDFTVNALYYDPSSESIMDYHQGLADLQRKTLRMIGDPSTRYREDPVRMLRAVRFAAKLDFSIEAATRAPIRELSGLISNIPPSRLFDEMLKMLNSGQAYACLLKLRKEGLHKGILPLLDVVLEASVSEQFIRLALAKTDLRVQEGKPISPGFLFATLLWQEVRVRWEALKAQSEAPLRPIPALFQAMDEVLSGQSEKLALTHRIAGDIKDIWALQPRFEQRSGKRPFSLVEQLRFKAAHDFLRLRADAGEVPAELADWWDEFRDADGSRRHEMLQPVPVGEAKKRRRRRKPRAEEG